MNLIDESKVAVVNINLVFIDGQSAAAVEYSSPASKVSQLAGPTQFPDGFRVKSFAVVDGEVPIAVRPICSLCPGAAEGDAFHSGQALECICDLFNEFGFEIVI